MDKQKMLVSLPGGKTLEDYLGAAASRNVELPEAVEDLLLMIKGLDDGQIKTRLLQETRVLLDHHKGPGDVDLGIQVWSGSGAESLQPGS